MANRLSEAKRAELWSAFQERQSIDFLARKCGVHHRTVERYRVLDRWDERLAKVREDAQKRADYTLAIAMADSLRLVLDYKRRLGEALGSKKLAPGDVTATELERIIKLEAFVLGGVESRHQIVSDFASWTEKELEEFARDGTIPREPGSRAT